MTHLFPTPCSSCVLFIAVDDVGRQVGLCSRCLDRGATRLRIGYVDSGRSLAPQFDRQFYRGGDLGSAQGAIGTAARDILCNDGKGGGGAQARSEENTSELQSLIRISYAVFCLTKKNTNVEFVPNSVN